MIFKPELAAAIVLGEKTATRRIAVENPRAMWRLERPWRYEPGKRFAVQPGRGKDGIAMAIVTNRRMDPLSAVTSRDARCEGFPTRDAFVAAWRAINGSYDPDQRVHVVEFELDGPYCAGCDGCGWCEGSPAFSCTDCRGTGRELSAGALAVLAEVRPDD